MTQLSNVLMQPKPDAVERLTLVEKLEREVNRLLELKAQEKPHSLGYVFLGHHIAATVNAINIVDRHQAENGWISADERLPTENDGRVSWEVNGYRKYILVNIVSRGIAMTCRFNLIDKCFETADKVTHWMPLPKPPSEVAA